MFSALNLSREALDEIRQAVQMVPNHMSYRINLAVLANLAGSCLLVSRPADRSALWAPRNLL